MRGPAATLLAALAIVGGCALTEAFLGTPSLGLRPSLGHAAAAARSPRLRQGLRMGYLDDLKPSSESINKGLDGDGKQIMPSTGYEDFIDADGFDGGDGQVGVVGDGSNAMETFDNRAVMDNTVGGSMKRSGASSGNRVDKRWNAWGSDMADITEDLRKQGVEQYDVLTGEDMRKVNRQQLNNWAAQRAVWAKESAQREELEAYNGEHRQKGTADYFSVLESGKASTDLTDKEKENVIFATGARGIENKEALKKTNWPPVAEGKRIDGTFEIQRAGMVTIPVEPNSMVAEWYIARFTDDTNPNLWVVAQTGYDLGERQVDGQLPRRGQPVEFFVRFNPSGPLSQPAVATLVIDTEDWKWTYKITGST